MLETATAPGNQVFTQWKSADRLAAQVRLELAHRHQRRFERLDAEFANLRASQSWLATQGSEDTAHLLKAYVEVLAPYLRERGFGAELLQWCRDALPACVILQCNPGWLLLLSGEAYIMLGQWDEAIASVQAAIEVSEEVVHIYARAILALGRLQLNQGDYDTALKTLSRAERLLAEQADDEGLAAARTEVAAYYLNRQELDKALLYLEVDQPCKQAETTTAPSDHTLLMLGVVYRKKGDYEQATRYLRLLLERSEAQNNRGAVAAAAHHLAWVCLNQGDLARARRQCGRAVALYDEIGDIRGASDAYEQLGLIALADKQGCEALPYLERSLVIRRQLGNQHGVASSLRHLAAAYLGMGHPVDAARALWHSLVIYRRIGVLTCHRFVAIIREFIDWAMGNRRWTV